jgi:O-antigen ligase
MEKWVRCFLFLTIVCSLISVFMASLFLGLAILAWALDSALGRRLKLKWPPYFGAVAVFLLVTLLAVAFSEDVALSMRYLKKFLHFAVAALVFTYLDRRWLIATAKAILVVAFVSASVGLYQYFVLHQVTLLGRVTGLMSHWMTFSGQLMMVAILLAACLLAVTTAGFKTSIWIPATSWMSGRYRLGALLTAGLGVALLVLVLSMTRSAWIGCFVGVTLLLALRSWRLFAAGVVVALIIVVVFPARFSQRLQSSFDPTDYTNRVRVELLKTGLNAIKAHPYMGIGPRLIAKQYGTYRTDTEFPGHAYQHLHNNFMQVAAEMGLFALAAWLAIWAKIAWDQVSMLRRARKSGDGALFWITGAAAASLLAFLAAGLFEYNFGDSEVLTLLLFVLTAPYVWDRAETSAAATDHAYNP